MAYNIFPFFGYYCYNCDSEALERYKTILLFIKYKLNKYYMIIWIKQLNK